MPVKGKKAQQDTLVTEIRRWLHDGRPEVLAKILEDAVVEQIKDYEWASPEERPLYVAEHLADLGGEVTKRALKFLHQEVSGGYRERLRQAYDRAEKTAKRHMGQEPAEDSDPNPEESEHGESEDDGGGPGGLPGGGATQGLHVLSEWEERPVSGLLRASPPEDAPSDGRSTGAEGAGALTSEDAQEGAHPTGDVSGDSA